MTDQQNNDNKKSRGRPATGIGQMLGVRLHDDLLKPLDAVIGDEPDMPSRPEMIRRIIKEWLIGRGYLDKSS